MCRKSSAQQVLANWLTQVPAHVGYLIDTAVPDTVKGYAVIHVLDGETAQLARLATRGRRVSPLVDLEPEDTTEVVDTAMMLLEVLRVTASPQALARAALGTARGLS
jgi:hypothetical protein